MAERTTVQFPVDLAQNADGTALYGYVHTTTQQVVVVGGEAEAGLLPGSQCLGWLAPTSTEPLASENAFDCALVAYRDASNGQLHFRWRGEACMASPYNLESDLFSRHSGLLETSALLQSGVIVCGCGSVGSMAALDLARSGVGRFLLIDPDVLAIENLSRHQCGLADVGRRKVEAVAERLHQINPRAQVEIHALPLERLDPAVVARFCKGSSDTLMLTCADSRRADRYSARLATELALPFLAIGLWERAFAGEIFYSHPDTPMPCYCCAFEGLQDTLGVRSQPVRRFYSDQTDLEKLQFQPGLALDIAHVTGIGLKLALDLLNRRNSNYVPRLLGRLSQYTLVCNSNDPRLGGERAEIFSHPLQVTTSIQVDYGAGCSCCQWSQ